MTVFQLKRSNTADKRPDPALLLSGELALNYDAATGGVYYTTDAGNLAKIGPAQVSATAPNATPAGSTGNGLGEFWYDTVNNQLNIWNGVGWTLVSAGTAPVGYLENGGSKVEGLTSQAAASAVKVLFDSSQVNYNLDSLTYASGTFTNNTTDSRTYTFDYQLNLSSVDSNYAYAPVYIWFQKGSASGLDAANSYGLSSYVYGPNQSGVALSLITHSTAWTFTLAPGESISCWASFDSTVLTFGGNGLAVSSPNGTRVNVSEVVAIETGYQSGGWAEYAQTGALVTASSDNKLDWNSAVAQASDFTLTYDSTNKTFFNYTAQTRTYRFDAVLGGRRDGNAYTEWDGWFQKNSYAGITSTGRYGQQVDLRPNNVGGIQTIFPLARTVSWVFELAPGDNISTWWYANAPFSSNAAITTPGGVFPNNQVCKLRITEVQATQSPLSGGSYTNTLSAFQAVPANSDYRIRWDGNGSDGIESLSYLDGIFTNTSDVPRTYLISNQVTLTGGNVNNPVSTWLQLNQNTTSPSARYSFYTGFTDDISSFVRSYSQVLTLQPGDSFSTWVYSVFAGSIGTAAFGMNSEASTRLWIADITAQLGGAGTVTGVVAGTGLSGGGYNGIVTLDLSPATSTLLGGVKQGSGVSIAVDGTISVAIAGSSTQVLFNNAGVFSGDADLTYNSTTNTLSVPAVDGATVDCGSY